MDTHFQSNCLEYTDKEIRGFVEEIQRKGIVELEGFFDPETLKKSQEFADTLRENLKANAFSLRYYDMDPCIMTELQESTHLKQFLSRILWESGVETNEKDTIHHVLRCTQGESNTRDAHKYHFDAYDLTLLMPILTPSSSSLACGDLVVYPNTRKFSQGLIRNVLIKVLFQNRVTRKFAAQNWVRNKFGGSTVKVKPGNAYLFYGFRTYHGNIEIDQSLCRVTGLFHFHDPFSSNKLIKHLELKRKYPQHK